MSYLAIKMIHLICVVASLIGFFARGAGHLAGASWVDQKWVKVAPHVVDTLLLVSGVGLIMVTHQYPGETPWVNVKLGLVVIYILLGMAAFRLARNRLQVALAWVGALGIAALILVVARTHQVPSFVL